MTELSNVHNIQAWSNFSREMIEAVGDEGDAARRYILNPVLFALTGDVAGRSLLDAGCGAGYLCRLFAQRGAHVTGIEPAPRCLRTLLHVSRPIHSAFTISNTI
ncbi:MAG: methyltransferase domain-containing protein [Blastochloris sp.]|nr:methyltransferase domain-containing protein [Blastochloris sp.]